MRVLCLFLSICIFSIEGKSTKKLRFEQAGVPTPHIPADVTPDDSEDPNHYYVLNYDSQDQRVTVFDVWYNISDMSMEAEFVSTKRRLLQGDDPWEEVTNNENFPWNSIGSINFDSKATGLTYLCTGVLVSERVVLTNAFCLYDQEYDEFYDNVRFYPGATASSYPYGEYSVKTISVKRKYSDEKNDNYDFGVALLRTAPPVQHMTVGYSCYQSYFDLNIAGYPGDSRPQDMYGKFCTDVYLNMCPSGDVSAVEDTCYNSLGDMMGGPMWESKNGRRTIRALTSRDINVGVGVTITPYVYDFITDNIQEWEN